MVIYIANLTKLILDYSLLEVTKISCVKIHGFERLVGSCATLLSQ